MYLKDRRSLMLNHNPFMAFQQDPNTENNHQVRQQSSVIRDSLDCVFKRYTFESVLWIIDKFSDLKNFNIGKKRKSTYTVEKNAPKLVQQQSFMENHYIIRT